MGQKKRLLSIVVTLILLVIIAFLNNIVGIISIPDVELMQDRQVDFITISTVFAGFSFTALGLLLGLSSEKLIERIRRTDIIVKKVDRIVTSIVYFILSVVISLYYMLGIQEFLFSKTKFYDMSNAVLYVVGIGCLILGIGYFVYSVFELYDLIRRVYKYNDSEAGKRIEKAKQEMEKNAEKLDSSNFDE